MPRSSAGKPIGSQNLALQQAVVANFPLYVTLAAGPAPFIQDVDLMEVLGAALSAANPVISGIYDALGNRMPAMDVAARPGYVDVIDRAARLLGIVYGDLGQINQVVPADALAPGNTLSIAGMNFVYNGATWDMVREGNVAGSILTDPSDRAARLLGVTYGSQAQQLQQVPATFELITQDTGLNTNPERWLHDNHWEADEVTINAAGVGGEQNLGAVVGAGVTRRIRSLNIRHAGTNPTVVTLLISGGATKESWDIPAQTTRKISDQDGWEFDPAEQPAIQSSDVTGGNTFVSARGVEA